ncbi:MAG TPA: AAC(3) family N-acetyltransferase [Desulfobacteraceae bacterium]|nr:AAC(3) family N-acetyltransferase [Desulfobacteraceae bacterium]HPQ27798.1 AAC(3) family N-acetyltransferase [Desulfobacteraceae bacterium]
MRQLKTKIKAFLPGFILNRVVTFREQLISKKKSFMRARLRKIPFEDLIRDLKSAGIEAGDTIMVHSSLSRIGNVQGGSDTVIKCLMEVTTKDGTILMPAYGSAEDVHRCREIVDLRTRKSRTGMITERFRCWPDVYRSSHPFSSICAWGKEAQYITADHAIEPRICHKDSPIARLVKLNGKVVGLGVSLGPVSLYHIIEDTWEDFPFRVYMDPFRVKYIDTAGNTIMREALRYDPTVSSTRIDHEGGKWIRERFTAHFTRKGILRWFMFGDAESWVMDTQHLYSELKRLAGKGITMYLTKDKWITMSGGSESTDSW